MNLKGYDELDRIQIDAIREMASIGAGNAATALSNVLSQPVNITVPKVDILPLSEASNILGEPEHIVSGIVVRMTGDFTGMMLYVQEKEFINIVLETVMGRTIEDYSMLNEIEQSAIIEIGNIILSSYITALSQLTGMQINLSVPAHCINMAGAILSVPMMGVDFTGDKIMLLDGSFVCRGKETSSKLLLLPDVKSLDRLLQKMGVSGE